jgi:two-component system OmpR family sensor kinase
VFASFRSRITRGYVLSALLIIIAIVGASSVLAFLLYAHSMNDDVAGAAQRAPETASRLVGAHGTLTQAAPEIAQAIGRRALHVWVIDAQGRRLAQNEREEPLSASRQIAIAFGRAIGLPRARVAVPGGSVVISPDIDRFSGLLLWYWSIMLPIGLVALLLAWLAGRGITARAIGPLADVTKSLRVIASGDFSPQPLLNGNSELRELTGAYNDVAYSLATATAERTRTEAQMRQFIADAGHELRTPLTIIMGYLDALRHGMVQGSQGTQRTYETMIDESRKMRTLIEKLILLARLERAPSGALASVDLGKVARDAVETLRPLANGRIQVDAGLSAYVTANEAELHEAVKNAIDNALKYAPQSEVRVTVHPDGASACVEVSDSGPGMDPQDVAHAFDRFYRGSTRGETEGSGLGLAIAKLAVERAGGTASIESAPGRGTRVRFCLPSSAKPPAPA